MSKYSWCNSKKEIIHCILNNLTEAQECKLQGCTNKSKFKGDGYHDYCCVSHASKGVYNSFPEDKKKKLAEKKVQAANKAQIEKYGCLYFETEQFKEKAKQTKLEKYNDVNYNNSKKNRETRIKNNNGVYWSEEQRSKVIQTCIDRYDDPNYNNREQCIRTRLRNNNGVLVSQEQKDKMKSTRLQNNNGVYISEEQLNKMKRTRFERYGDENFNNREKCKQTCLAIYGFEYAMMHPLVIEKHKKSVLESNIKSGRWYNYEDKSDWYIYAHKVRKLTEIIYKLNKDKINPNDYPRGVAGTAGAYQLDHIYSVNKGFVNNVPVHIIAGLDNLQMLPWFENISKGTK